MFVYHFLTIGQKLKTNDGVPGSLYSLPYEWPTYHLHFTVAGHILILESVRYGKNEFVVLGMDSFSSVCMQMTS